MTTATRFAAHRGGAALWPENSLLAFRQALALDSDLIEFDVHQTADGGLAVIHDPTLDRTTDATGPVAARTAAELRQARLRGPDRALTDERVPMLEEVLALVASSRTGLLVEVKGPVAGVGVRYERRGGRAAAVPGPRYAGLEERLVASLRRAGLLSRSTIMAFNPDVVPAIRALVPDQRTALLVSAHQVGQAGARPEDAVAWAVAAGATDAGLQYTLVDAAVVKAARAAGLRLGVWTVNRESAMRRLVELGVDVLTSDRPDLAKRVLGRAP
jgi:glycerophosphoryl diester phosphodiesterase